MKSNFSKGKFIVCEGGEGCGKTTQIDLLKNKYKNSPNIIFTREPGGTEISDQIRNIITTGNSNKILPETELALIYAARYEHIHKLILPALNSGKTVVCDRFLLSTLVYQGVARGVSLAYINMFNNLFLQNLQPDFTLLFDLDINIAKKRIKQRNISNERFEKFPDDFHEKIRQGYLTYAKNNNNIAIIDATKSPEKIHELVCYQLENF